MDAIVPSDYLLEEILIEILGMLPVKSLVRFITVCKLWRSLIIDPCFIAKHLNRASSYGNAYLLHVPTTFCNTTKCTLLHQDSLVEHSKLQVPFETISGFYHMVGSCNGLLCLTDGDYGYHHGRTLYFWNPTLRNFRTCHHSCVAHRFIDLSFHVALGFGFDSRSQDHKVIRIFYYLEDGEMTYSRAPPEAEVYTLSTNTWTSIGSVVPCVMGCQSGAFINGSVHWLAINWKKGNKEVIFSFDMSSDVFDEILVPHNYSNGDIVESMFVGEFKGCISLFVYCHDIENDGSNLYHIWVMRECGVVNSWTKKYTILLNETIVKSFGFTKNGQVMMETVHEELEIWDPETLETKIVKGLDTSYPYSVVPFIESLVFHGIKTAPSNQPKSIDGVLYQGIDILIQQEVEEQKYEEIIILKPQDKRKGIGIWFEEELTEYEKPSATTRKKVEK